MSALYNKKYVHLNKLKALCMGSGAHWVWTYHWWVHTLWAPEPIHKAVNLLQCRYFMLYKADIGRSMEQKNGLRLVKLLWQSIGLSFTTKWEPEPIKRATLGIRQRHIPVYKADIGRYQVNIAFCDQKRSANTVLEQNVTLCLSDWGISA
jgi:hypothetical protein